MAVLSVGALYHPSHTRWPECAQYNYRAGEHRLELFFASPEVREIREIRRGQAEIAVLVGPRAIWLLWRFGEGPWSDAPYSIHLVPEEDRTLPPLASETETRSVLQVVLVDAATGVLRAIRAVSLSPQVSATLDAAIRAQAAQPWDEAAYDREIASTYARAPSSESLVRLAQARCVGGA